MNYEKKEFYKAASVLIKLTQQKAIKWKYLTDVNGVPRFITEFDGQYLCVSQKEWQITNNEELENYKNNLERSNRYIPSYNLPFRAIRSTLDVTNEKGNLIWSFPYNPGIDDLFEIVQLSVANITELFNKIFEKQNFI